MDLNLGAEGHVLFTLFPVFASQPHPLLFRSLPTPLQFCYVHFILLFFGSLYRFFFFSFKFSFHFGQVDFPV